MIWNIALPWFLWGCHFQQCISKNEFFLRIFIDRRIVLLLRCILGFTSAAFALGRLRCFGILQRWWHLLQFLDKKAVYRRGMVVSSSGVLTWGRVLRIFQWNFERSIRLIRLPLLSSLSSSQYRWQCSSLLSLLLSLLSRIVNQISTLLLLVWLPSLLLASWYLNRFKQRFALL